MESQRTEISALGEFGLIDRISAQFKNEQKSTLKGIGDDAVAGFGYLFEYAGMVSAIAAHFIFDVIMLAYLRYFCK
jgi:hypothetical protein